MGEDAVRDPFDTQRCIVEVSERSPVADDGADGEGRGGAEGLCTYDNADESYLHPAFVPQAQAGFIDPTAGFIDPAVGDLPMPLPLPLPVMGEAGHNGLMPMPPVPWPAYDMNIAAEQLEAFSQMYMMRALAFERAAANTDPNMITRAATSSADKTTVIMRNVPNNYTRDMLIKLIQEQGFGMECNMVYLPMDFRRGANLGYAFINLVSCEAAQNFTSKMDGFKSWAFPSSKVCQVDWGNESQQGLDAHIERYRNSEVMHPAVPEEYKPILFEAGVKMPFPEPTMPIRPPRYFRQGR